MIDSTFIEALCDRLDKDEINTVEIDGKRFSTQSLQEIKPDAPLRPETINLSTLSSFAEYIEDNVEELTIEDCMVHIEDPNTVRLASRFSNDNFKQRTIYVKAHGFIAPFKFGQEYGQEAFVLALNTLFADTEDKIKLLSLVSNIVTEESITSSDDGLHQSCVVKTGTVKVNQVEIPRLVTLRPYRYFLEVEQVQSKFMLRMRQSPDKKALIVLHEIDGGFWKLEAMKLVKQYLEDKLTNVTILA